MHSSPLLRHWPRLWALVFLAPATLAVTSMSTSVAAAAIVMGFGLPTLIALATTSNSVRALRVQLPAALRFGICAAVTCLGFGGLFAFSPPLAWAALAAYAVTAAWAHHTRTNPPAQAADAPQESQDDNAGLHVATGDEVRSMTDAELCEAWRRSFVALMSTRSVGHRAGVVSLRHVLLDEMEARDPAGLQAWLRSGARAAGGPDQFLDPGDEGGATQVA